MSQIISQLRQSLSQTVIGQNAVIEELTICLVAGGHVLLEGLPGTGKTLLCRTLAGSFGGKFGRVQFTPDLMPADITGHSIYNPGKGAFVLRRGPVFANLLLADEINRAPAKTQAALLEVMQEYQVTIDGKTLPLPRPFMTVATQNPIELEGTYPLPEAQLDRFLMKVIVPYPEQADEYDLVTRVTDDKSTDALDLSDVRPVLDGEQVMQLQRDTAHVAIDASIVEYAVNLVRHSRTMPGIAAGASPRAAISLVRCARAKAFCEGRDFTLPDDVKRCAPGVMRHRLRLTPELEIEGRTNDQMIDEIIGKVAAPRT